MKLVDQIRRLLAERPGQNLTLPAETVTKLLDEIDELKNEIIEINEHNS